MLCIKSDGRSQEVHVEEDNVQLCLRDQIARRPFDVFLSMAFVDNTSLLVVTGGIDSSIGFFNSNKLVRVVGSPPPPHYFRPMK
ncbi:hypothetical protein GBA52_017073 [Prunus armeniaca]|nr:hypothetical protein GBA52_017073 [Prunus armeniaca]